MGREERIKVFENTRYLYETDEYLKSAVKESRQNQKIVLENSDEITGMAGIMGTTAVGEVNGNLHPEIVVSRKRTLEAAIPYARQGLRVAVHNFASATNPGGGVQNGAGAQEECLCRCSTLFPCLNSKPVWDGFYSPHRNAHDPINNGDIICTPDVVVFKTDTDLPETMPKEDWYTVDVITCAAPNLREKPSNSYNPGNGDSKISMSDEELEQIHIKRLTGIFNVAGSQGCDVLILGAFGCGAFRNPPEFAAKAAKAVVEKFGHRFKVIEFAVYCRPDDDTNYRIFEKVLGKR